MKCDQYTTTQRRIIEAFKRGYRVTDDGVMYGPKGRLSVKLYGKQRYPTFSTNWGGQIYGVPVHQFAAYCFFGQDALDNNLVVRHLDGNTLNFNKSNIVLGTHRDNNLDKPAETRRRAAVAARNAQGYTPLNAKLSKADVQAVRNFYTSLNGKRAPQGSVAKLAASLGVTRATLHKIKSGEYYASISN